MQIINPSSLKKTGNPSGFSGKELSSIEQFLGTESKEIPNPIPLLANKVLLVNFGWPAPEAKKIVRLILIRLEELKKVSCRRSKDGKILGVNVLAPAPTPSSLDKSAVTQQGVKQLQKEDQKKEEETTNQRRGLGQKEAKILLNRRRLSAVLGGRLTQKGLQKRGERHENWLHTSLLYLIDILISKFPEIVIDGRCTRSGKHDPAHGQIDLQDHYGEDVTLKLTTRPNPGLSNFSGTIIYDAKGSKEDVLTFNRKIIFHPGQKGALMKRAIWCNIIHRSQSELIAEVLDDLTKVGLLPHNIDRSKILESFQD